MSRLHGTKDFWLGALRTEGPAFAAAVAEAPPQTPVLSCPGWTVSDLAHHLTRVYMWARTVVTAGTATRPERQDPEPPAGLTAAQWYRREYDQLMALFEGLDVETPAWNFAPQPKKAGFWPRRMAHETAVHRWDAQLAIGAGEPIEAKLAADGVSEVLDTWLPAGRRIESGQWHGVVQLTATDAAQDWYLRLRGEGMALLDTATILDHDEHHARAQVSGTASDLLLALMGRISFDALGVAGDRRLLSGLRVG
ncbi:MULTISPECIES: maleylpyruvate isomerase family mycothiol-dependent enzyme [Micromonospora]|uniref:Maleylpyruvate isomerase family mycothiol-dependent enzyme n=1 Tax=Micromonospora solifontis TaxID=2487138 RepID=A0ABX9WK27_9ACTN|nr:MULTISPECIES: maleylpyruvate isomerase family mycothiol-dependent enzyme [Micromonospora]NES15648.1 maleylpyruvate isomerase family mycothiol-dependent enzyme [Micromonospora sp. PPF5-17B]NES35948.1 maleylpyruvate isomerase family mycothiol-dependent enzyme [Micromonospora solifontis]NES56979.1 maleylpyruvate isomerase family mycothiol-dependent enzyme [Micromonospora sp. PPF5-6]RNM00056.1 maleylpyruvate isomerase family mycothiol-dependent enzyme [Micromonospora solifontis]